MGRPLPSGRRQRPTKRCSQASMPLDVPGLPSLPEWAATNSRPMCSTDFWPPLPARAFSSCQAKQDYLQKVSP